MWQNSAERGKKPFLRQFKFFFLYAAVVRENSPFEPPCEISNRLFAKIVAYKHAFWYLGLQHDLQLLTHFLVFLKGSLMPPSLTNIAQNMDVVSE